MLVQVSDQAWDGPVDQVAAVRQVVEVHPLDLLDPSPAHLRITDERMKTSLHAKSSDHFAFNCIWMQARPNFYSADQVARRI